MTSRMIPNMIICHLEQLLFSKYCCKMLYLEFAVKFSFQEHTRPPRIQEEKSGLDSRFPKSGLDLTRKYLLEQYLTSRKLREWPQKWPFYPFLEGKFGHSQKFLTVMFSANFGKNFFFLGFGMMGHNIFLGQKPGTAKLAKWLIKTMRSLTRKRCKEI